MIRGRAPTFRYRYHVLLDTQNRGLCDRVPGRHTAVYKQGLFYVSFGSHTEHWDTTFSVPGVKFFRCSAFPGGGNALQATNHPLWSTRLGIAFDWAIAVNALGLQQE